ncbi:MAG TPA: CDGSH iron-sulfur domain-containing protein [Nocardioides sp.]|nr:CDGSH iron-sulfur domain-containing protein [Nocardioides sp.]
MSGSVRVRLCPDGPVLVRGAEVVLDEGGSEHRVTRPVVALCACGRSSLKPWCDGTHQVLGGRTGDRDDD